MAQVDFMTALAQGAQPAPDEFMAALAKAAPQEVAPPTPAPPPAQPAPTGGKLGPWLSAVVRPIVKGATSLASLPADALVGTTNGIYSYLHGSKPSLNDINPFAQTDPAQPQLPSQALNSVLDRYTTAPTGAGKAAEFVSSVMAGSRMPMPFQGGALPPGIQATAKEAQEASSLTSAQQQAAQQGKALGFKLTPGQASGSKPLQQVETWAQSHPWTSAPFAKLAKGNQETLNKTAAQAIGENSPVVDANTLGGAADRIGDVFNQIRTNTQKLPVDSAATEDFLKNLKEETEGLLPGNGSITDHPLIQTLQGITKGGEVTAKQLGQLSSKLGKAAYKQMSGQNGDRDLGQALYDAKNHVDDLLESNLTGEGKTAYAQARAQYRALMQLTSRANIVNSSTGNVNGVALASRLQQADKPGFLYGKNQSPLYSAARFAQAFKPIVGDSGTATRSANFFDPLELAMGVPAHIASRLYMSPVGGAAARGTVAGAQAAKQLPSLLRRLAPLYLSGIANAQASR